MTTRSTRVALVLISVATAVGLAACGEDEHAGHTGSADDIAGNSTDRAFAMDMVPHHHSAVEMAELAKTRATHAQIKRLADSIIASQSAEIEDLQRLDDRLEKAGVEPGELGMSSDMMGQDMDTFDGAKPFDRAFIDAMIAHHQSAIHMARAELDTGENPDLQRIANAIVDAQSKEIDRMNIWRVNWYGGISPSGGVPIDDDGDDGHHGG